MSIKAMKKRERNNHIAYGKFELIITIIKSI